MSEHVWIKNNKGASSRVKLHAEAGSSDGAKETIFDFPRPRVNRVTGAQEHNGYTRITEDEYNALYAGSKIFKECIDLKLFLKFDTPPEDAFTDAERINLLHEQVASLQAQLAANQAPVKGLQDQLTASQAQVKNLQDQLTASQAQVKELQVQLDAATTGGNEFAPSSASSS